MSKFLLRTARNGEYYYILKAANGEPIGKSEGYTTKQSALNGIDSCRRNAPYSERYNRWQGRDNQYYWHLKAANGQVLLQSEGYTSAGGANVGIESCMKNAPIAAIVDETVDA